MFLKKATALALLALAPTLLAACGSDGGNLSGSAVEDPSKPVEPGNPPVAPVNPPAEKPGDSKPAPGVAPSGGAGEATLLGYVQSLAPTRRVDLADMKDACRASADCQADVAKFEAHLLTLCPTEADCKSAVGMLLYKERSPQQVAQQIYAASFPQAKDVLPIVEESLGPSAGGDDAAPVAGAFDATIDQLVEDLNAKAGTPVDMVEIGNLIVKIDPETGNAVTQQITQDIADAAPADPAVAETATKLAAGEPVDAAAAAALIDEVVKGDAGGDPAKPGSEPAAVDAVALQKAAEGLRQGVGMTVEWAGVKGMLGDDVAAAVEGFAGDTTLINSGTLTDLLDGKSVDAVAVADLLDEIANAAQP
ncbi:MAG: hypothetical protein IPG72_02020 [Ardenticatenales bacterium]|nr:hypothetical protein [Ardenticatenales bacterium]